MKAARSSLSIGLAAALLATPALAGPIKRPVVVELFTSQGCNSCPPADALLGRLATRPDVLAISLPITYWDMLGWKDTLATEANTRRQKAYAQYMGRGGVYTPQIIVDGVTDVVGSREGEVEAAIAKEEAEIESADARGERLAASLQAAVARREAVIADAEARHAAAQVDHEAREEAASYHETMRTQALEGRAEQLAIRSDAIAEDDAARVSSLAIPISLSESPNEMHIAIAGVPTKSEHDATIWLFHLRDSVSVNVRGGENDGHTLTYHNVASDVRRVGVWNGAPVSLDLPKTQMAGLPHDVVAVVLQQGGYGRVIGAAAVNHPAYAPER